MLQLLSYARRRLAAMQGRRQLTHHRHKRRQRRAKERSNRGKLESDKPMDWHNVSPHLWLLFPHQGLDPEQFLRLNRLGFQTGPFAFLGLADQINVRLHVAETEHLRAGQLLVHHLQ